MAQEYYKQLDVLNYGDLAQQSTFVLVSMVIGVIQLIRLKKIYNLQRSLITSEEAQVLSRKFTIHLLLLIFTFLNIISMAFAIGIFLYIADSKVNKQYLNMLSSAWFCVEYTYITVLNMVFIYISYIYVCGLLYFQHSGFEDDSIFEANRMKREKIAKIISIVIYVIFTTTYFSYLYILFRSHAQQSIIQLINIVQTSVCTALVLLLSFLFYRKIFEYQNIKKNTKRTEALKAFFLVLSLIFRVIVNIIGYITAKDETGYLFIRQYNTNNFHDTNHYYMIYLFFANIFTMVIPTIIIMRTFNPSPDIKQQEFAVLRSQVRPTYSTLVQ